MTWSGSIDPRPAVVAEAATPSDVQAAVLIAQDHGLPFAVQATGHGTHSPVRAAYVGERDAAERFRSVG